MATTRLESAALGRIVSDLARSSARRVAAVAYVSDDSGVRFRRGDLLIVDASEKAIRAGQTSATVLKRAVLAGAEVWSRPGLHAKVLVCGNTAIVGSANLSAAAAEPLREAAVVSDDAPLVEQVHKLIESYKRRALRLSKQAVSELEKIEVDRPSFGPIHPGSRRQKPSLLEALQSADPLLDDYAFFGWTHDAIESDAEVKRQAERRNIQVPKGDLFGRFEDDDLPSVRKVYRRLFERERRKVISFEIVQDGKTNRIQRFVGLDPQAYIYSGHFVLRRRIQCLLTADFKPPFRLGGAGAKLLCRLLNAGLKSDTQLAKRIFLKDGGCIDRADLLQLIRAALAVQQANGTGAPPA